MKRLRIGPALGVCITIATVAATPGQAIAATLWGHGPPPAPAAPAAPAPPPTTAAPPPPATPSPPANSTPPAAVAGYRVVTDDGGLYDFGGAVFKGAANGGPSAPAVAVGATPSGLGYWVATAAGGVSAFGDAGALGALTTAPATPVVALVASPDGNGYWLITSDGTIDRFGDAAALASPGPANGGAPYVAAARTPDGNGLWLADLNGAVTAVGDAPAMAAPAGTGIQSTHPLVGIAPTSSGQGYWLAYTDGSVAARGDAVLHGSMAGAPLTSPITGIEATVDGGGYWLFGADGGVFTFGDAPFLGAPAQYGHVPPAVGLVEPGGSASAGAALVLGLLATKTFSLTFDDGPSAYTSAVLAVLEQKHVLATFFEIGDEVQGAPQDTAMVAAAGDFVGNHSFTHPYLTTLAPSALAFQIDRTSQVIEGVVGRLPSCLRPPYGAINGAVTAAVVGRGLRIQLWNDDPSDYLQPPPSVIVARVLAEAKPGGVVIMHDGGGPRGNTAAALPSIIDALRAQGYTLAPVCY